MGYVHICMSMYLQHNLKTPGAINSTLLHQFFFRPWRHFILSVYPFVCGFCLILFIFPKKVTKNQKEKL